MSRIIQRMAAALTFEAVAQTTPTARTPCPGDRGLTVKKWVAALVAVVLMLVGAIGAEAYTDAEYDDLVSYVKGIRDKPPNTAVRGNPVHIAKWNRVLAAIGADGQGKSAWPESVIHANAAKWPDSPWKRPSDYLKWKAEQEAQAQQDQQVQQQPPPPPTKHLTGLDRLPDRR